MRHENPTRLLLRPPPAGFPFADTANYQPFLPFGVRGVFAGAAVVFFSFIGFDTVRGPLWGVPPPPKSVFRLRVQFRGPQASPTWQPLAPPSLLPRAGVHSSGGGH